MSEKTYITTQIDEESELYQRYEDFVDEKGHSSKSAATRELVRFALDEHESSDPAGGWTVLERVLLTASSVLAAIVALLPLLYFGGILTLTTTIAAGLVYLAASGSLALAVSYGLFRRTGPAVEAPGVSN